MRALYPEGMHATIAAGVAARAGRSGARAHRDAAGARARPHAGGPGRHRRADLVGPHRARPRSTTPWWTASRRRCSAGWACSRCTRRTTRRSSSACSAPRAACAGATRASASWCGPSTPPIPIAAGVPHPIVIDAHEMYGEHFDIPAPDELVFVSSFAGGEVFRGGCCFRRGAGRIFYFSPGDQDYPIYHHPDVRRVIANAVEWAAPRTGRSARRAGQPRVAARMVRARGRMSAARDAGDLRVGVIGVGWAGHQHAAAYDALPGVELAAIAGLEDAVRAELADAPRRRAPRRALGGPARDRRARRGQRRRAHVPARADRARGARARPPRAVARSRSRAPSGGERDGRRRRARPTACSTSRSTTASAATSRRSRRSSTPAGSATPTTPRRGGCGAPGSRRSAAGSRAPSWPAAARCSTSASTCSTTRCSCSATRRSPPSAPSTYDLLGTAGFGSSPDVRQDRRDRRDDVRRRGPGDGVHAPGGRRHAARRGELGRAPLATATSSASRSTAPRAAPS